MTNPIRLQLSRRKGFDLQAISMATNGLEAIGVARPGRWHNIFVVTNEHPPGTSIKGKYVAAGNAQQAVVSFREMFEENPEVVDNAIAELRGKNLACWCQPGALCHADILLEICNR